MELFALFVGWLVFGMIARPFGIRFLDWLWGVR